METRISKNWKIDIFAKGLTHGFPPKMAIFHTFFLANRGPENVFYGILEWKNAFLGYENKNFKQSKNWHLPKGLTHYFSPKMVIFPIFFLGNIGQEKIFYVILERKNAFLGYKNKKF